MLTFQGTSGGLYDDMALRPRFLVASETMPINGNRTPDGAFFRCQFTGALPDCSRRGDRLNGKLPHLDLSSFEKQKCSRIQASVWNLSFLVRPEKPTPALPGWSSRTATDVVCSLQPARSEEFWKLWKRCTAVQPVFARQEVSLPTAKNVFCADGAGIHEEQTQLCPALPHATRCELDPLEADTASARL